MTFTALIAEDEWLLAANLQSELKALWPDLTVVATVGDGEAAVEGALRLLPDVLFLDIRMPGMTGLEAAQALAEDWTSIDRPFPLIVFVTAYDQYAVQAFERAAFDYVLKPVEPTRLAVTCERLKQRLLDRSASRPVVVTASGQAVEAVSTGIAGSAAANGNKASTVDSGDLSNPSNPSNPISAADVLDGVVMQMRALLAAGIPGATGIAVGDAAASPLKIIQASAGNTITMIPVEQVLYFEAADKYVRVVTAEREHLIRTSLRDLLQRIDPNLFWQIHRGVVVRCDAIASAHRDESGKLTLTLHGHADQLNVSRLYAERFRGM